MGKLNYLILYTFSKNNSQTITYLHQLRTTWGGHYLFLFVLVNVDDKQPRDISMQNLSFFSLSFRSCTVFIIRSSLLSNSFVSISKFPLELSELYISIVKKARSSPAREIISSVTSPAQKWSANVFNQSSPLCLNSFLFLRFLAAVFATFSAFHLSRPQCLK